MNNLYDILNIGNNNIEKVIQEVIDETKRELVNLDKEGTCFIYTSYLYQNLKGRNILCYIVDTMEDYDMEYQHRFIVIPKDEEYNYVLDLTVSQFGENNFFNEMKLKGYQLLNKNTYNSYLKYVSVKRGIKRHNY